MFRCSLAAALLSLAAIEVAQADCSADIRLQNSIAEQYNSLAGSPACDSGAQQAVILGLLQQAVEVTTRLESCETAQVGTSVAELNSMIANFDSNTAETCAQLRAFDQLDQDLEDFQDAIDEELKRLDEQGRMIDEELAKIQRKIKELEEAEKADKQKQAAVKQAPKADTSQCGRAVAHMKKLAGGGNDVSALKKELAGLGCATD